MIAHLLRDAGLAAAARIPVRAAPVGTGEVLVVRPDHMGDLLFLGPALRRFRRALPDARLTLAVGPWSRDVVSGSPDVDEVLAIPFPGFTRQGKGNPVRPYQELAAWAETIRARGPAAAVILRDDHWWGALLAQRAGVPLRIGADYPAVRRYLTHAAPQTGHWVERNAAVLDLAARLLGGRPAETPPAPATDPLTWDVSAAAAEAAGALLGGAGITGPYLVIAPGSGAPVKLWPAERWAAVASRVARLTGLAVVLTGSASEAPLAEAIRARMDVPAVALAGETDLATLGAVLRGARLVAGVDSGPLHLAVAVGTPTVHLYGPSLVSDYGPWGDPARHRVISAGMRCSRCGDLSPSRPEGAGCMVAIQAAQVAETILEMLADA